jgi:hypothetical protein
MAKKLAASDLVFHAYSYELKKKQIESSILARAFLENALFVLFPA